MSDVFKDLPYSDSVHCKLMTIQEEASVCKFPLDLTYLDLLHSLNYKEIGSRAGINYDAQMEQALDAARRILLNYGISDSPTALAHLERIEAAIAVWRDRKANFDREVQSKLADLEHAFVAEYPLPFVSDPEVSNA